MNRAILQRLRANSRLTWQQIGREVHLTGQAVAARVHDLQAQGVIQAFTIRQADHARHFVTVFLARPEFKAFDAFIAQEPCVDAAYKVTGEGCYQLEVAVEDTLALDSFLERLQSYGTYKVLHAMRQVK